jgi:hypothetical protein
LQKGGERLRVKERVTAPRIAHPLVELVASGRKNGGKRLGDHAYWDRSHCR